MLSREQRHAGIGPGTRAAVFAALSPAGGLARAVNRRFPVVLAYHDPDPETFARHVTALAARYTIVPLERIVSALAAGTLDALPTRPLAITIDDGHAGNMRLVEPCHELGVRPTVFACTKVGDGFWWAGLDALTQRRLKHVPDDERRAAVARIAARDPRRVAEARARDAALGEDDITALHAAGIDVQPHTRTHPVLPRCDDAVSRDEIAGSKRDLEQALGESRELFAYPNGDFCDRDVAFAAEAGIRFAFTTRPGFIRADSDPLRLPRVVVRDDAPVRELLVRAGGIPGLIQRHLPSGMWTAVQAR